MLSSTKRLVLVAGLAAVTGAVAGCAATSTTTAGATPGVPATSVAAPATTAPATTAPAPIKGGCPIDAATLETALKANTGLASAIVLGGGLKDVVCYQDFAVARTTPTQVDSATVLFVYDKSTATWKAVTAGTAVDCSEFVPAEITPHLPGCR